MGLAPVTPTYLSENYISKSVADFVSNEMRNDPLESIEYSEPSLEHAKIALDVPHRTMFNFYKWNGIAQRLVDSNITANKESTGNVSLPMPGNLETTYGVNYSEESLGGTTTGLMNAFGANSTTEAVGQIATGIGSDLINASALGRIASAQIGIQKNPHQVVFLQGVDFRQFQFNYRFSPQSREEALELLQIIKKFKMAMSVNIPDSTDIASRAARSRAVAGVNSLVDQPVSSDVETGIRNFFSGAAKNFFSYPDYFEIDFYHNNNPSRSLFKIGPSVLTSFNVQYHPNSIPSYATPFGGDDSNPTPTEVHLNMSFKEIEIITRSRIDGGR